MSAPTYAELAAALRALVDDDSPLEVWGGIGQVCCRFCQACAPRGSYERGAFPHTADCDWADARALLARVEHPEGIRR